MSRTDNSLLVKEFQASADIVPLNTYYQTEEARTASDTTFTFYITSPGANMLLDPEILLKALVVLDTNIALPVAVGDMILRNQFTDGSNAEKIAPKEELVCPRQAFALARAMSSISLTINGQVITCQPHEFQDALNRLYLSDEEARTYCSTSGGAMDSSPYFLTPKPQCSPSTLAVTGAAELTASPDGATNLNPGVTQLSKYSYSSENKGSTTRYNKMKRYQRGRHPGALSITAPQLEGNLVQVYPDNYTRWFVEPLQIAPFYMYPKRDSKKSIPHVDSMTISIQFNPNLFASIFGSLYEANYDSAVAKARYAMSVSISSMKPKLLLRWYVPPVGTTLEDTYLLPVWIQRSFQNTQPAVAPLDGASSGFTDDVERYDMTSHVFSFSNIRLEQFPDLMLIYIKPDPFRRQTADTSDDFCSISELEISVDGIAGKLLTASAEQLYQMWLDNVRHDGKEVADFDSWQFKLGVVALRPRDLGLSAGPGVDHPLTMHIRGKWQYRNALLLSSTAPTQVKDNVPADPPVRILYVQTIYERYSLRMSADGRSRLTMLKLPMPGQAPLAPAGGGSFGGIAL